jgi:hypothetical protein
MKLQSEYDAKSLETKEKIASLESSLSQKEVSHAEYVRDMNEKHSTQLSALSTELNVQHEKRVQELIKNHEENLSKSILEEKGKGETEIRRLISVHQQEILSVKVRC